MIVRMPVSHTRPLTVSDLDLVVRHRKGMFREMGRPEEELAAMSAGFRPWLEPRLRDGSYLGWVIEQEGAAVAGVGMMVLDWPPHPYHPEDSRRAYILNMFVEPEHRGTGLARITSNRCFSDLRQERGSGW